MSAESPRIDPGQALERLEQLASEAESALLAATSPEQVEDVRVRYLGRKAELTQILRSLPELPPDRRAEVGRFTRRALVIIRS